MYVIGRKAKETLYELDGEEWARTSFAKSQALLSVVVISSSSMVVQKNYEHIKMSNKSYKIASTVRTLDWRKKSREECVLLMFALLSYIERS